MIKSFLFVKQIIRSWRQFDKYYNKIAKFNAYLYSKLLASSTHICIFFECLQHKIGN